MSSTTCFWDAHACLPLATDVCLQDLARHRDAGCRVVGVNAGFDGMPPEATIATLTKFAKELAGDHEGLEDVVLAMRDDRDTGTGLGVYFDIEGAEVLGGDLRVLEELARIGLRSLVPVYNRANSAGGGCHDPTDEGLTPFGRDLIRRQNELGIIVDASHCSARTSLEMCTESVKPVIFSHSNCRTLVDHPRNVTDEQMRAAAATGGVIGINGSSLFLGSDDWPIAICEHILHAIEVVGVEHVGLGLDYVYDLDDLATLVADAPGLFPNDAGTYDRVVFCPPENWALVERRLSSSGLDQAAIEQVRWANFARVALETFEEREGG
jgi:membrane dipeptidase